jgi:hypothetical protein
MRNCNRCDVFRYSIKSGLDNSLALGIYRAGSFVKNNYAWLFDNAPSDCKTLFLTARKFCTAIANLCVVALQKKKKKY